MTLPVAHPGWCNPARCEALLDRAHSSGVLVVDRDRYSPARVQLRLWQWPGVPVTFVEVIVDDHDQAERIRTDLSLAQADLVRLFLGDLLRLTGGA